MVEVQLRTRVQHVWANESERLAYTIDRAIKAGGGPARVRDVLEELSDQGRLIDESHDWVVGSVAAIGGMSRFLDHRRADAAPLAEQSVLVNHIESLLSVALHLQGDLIAAYQRELRAAGRELTEQ